jgi:hypothetical protein
MTTRRRATRTALGLWLVALALVVAVLVMWTLGWRGHRDTSASELVALIVAFSSFATMGSLVAARVPRNPLGWIFIAAAVSAAISEISETLVYHAYVEDPGSVPGATVLAWMYAWAWYPTVALLGYIMLLYPTGTLPGRRWRLLGWIVTSLVALVTLVRMTRPGPLDAGVPRLPDNPLGIGVLARASDLTASVADAVTVALLVATAASVVARFRRSRGDERQQLKWMVFAVAILTLASTTSSRILFPLAIAQLPVALGIAMFKYRLYAVDRIISRTLVYGATTALLGTAYVGLVLGGEALFSSATGGSHLIVAASTLVVAALFLPLRRYIQTFVDRRFYRRRHDAQQTLEAFSGRLRHHVDLDALGAGLVDVIDETMRPVHVGLWLREAGR